MLIGILTSIFSAYNHTQSISVNNKQGIIQPNLINIIQVNIFKLLSLYT